MTATTTQVPAVIDYMVTACVNSPSLGGATPAVVVIDGPPLTTDTLAENLHLYIGHDQAAAGGAAADAVQAWPVLDKARTKDEDGSVVCTADAWGFGDVMKAARDACNGIVAAVELLLRGTPAAGGPGDTTMGGLVFWSAVEGPFTWSQRQDQQGAGCSCSFRITYRARLTS